MKRARGCVDFEAFEIPFCAFLKLVKRCDRNGILKSRKVPMFYNAEYECVLLF